MRLQRTHALTLIRRIERSLNNNVPSILLPAQLDMPVCVSVCVWVCTYTRIPNGRHWKCPPAGQPGSSFDDDKQDCSNKISTSEQQMINEAAHDKKRKKQRRGEGEADEKWYRSSGNSKTHSKCWWLAQGPRQKEQQQVSPGNLMWAASITLHCCPRSPRVSWLCCRCFSTAFSLHLFARLRRVASKGRRGACPLLLANRKLCTVALNCHEMRSQCAEAACGQPGCLSLASL